MKSEVSSWQFHDTQAFMMGALFFIPEKDTIRLLKELLEKEVNATEHATTLLRENSLTASVLSSALKRISMNYVKRTIKTLIEHITKNNVSSYQLDPSKMEGSEEEKQKQIKTNLEEFTCLLDTFLDAIIKSSSSCPM